jgi:iron(III) transport system ATP-binding protein
VVSVTLRDAVKLFGDTVAVDAVSLTIESGELFFLLGPSGCGKTTCLRMLAGFYEPSSGEIRFGDRVVNRVPPHQRNTGMVFQAYALWPHLTVWQNVEYGLDVRRVAREDKQRRVGDALEMVHMAEHAEKRPNQLSGGQQQRIALARALVIEPDLLLLDEPLSNLDAKLRIEMRAEIRRIQKRAGITAVYVTHDQAEALSMADRIAVMNAGRIEQLGTPREIYTRPASVFVAGFIGETNFTDGRIVDAAGERVTVDTPLGRLVGVPANGSLGAGASVTCSIRPESLRLADEASDLGENRLEAVLEHATYEGATEELALRVGEKALRAVVANPGRHGYAPGETVRLCVDAEDVVVLKAGGAGPA